MLGPRNVFNCFDKFKKTAREGENKTHLPFWGAQYVILFSHQSSVVAWNSSVWREQLSPSDFSKHKARSLVLYFCWGAMEVLLLSDKKKSSLIFQTNGIQWAINIFFLLTKIGSLQQLEAEVKRVDLSLSICWHTEPWIPALWGSFKNST